MKIKTRELTGAQLNWAVAKCEGLTPEIRRHSSHPMLLIFERAGEYGPSYSWAQGGPIIEREMLEVMPTTMCGQDGAYGWEVRKWLSECELFAEYGPTPLIAAMRCYVSSKLDDEVEIPEELT